MLSDVGVINELLSQGLINMISDVVVLITTVAVMLIINARLALLTFLVLPPMIVAPGAPASPTAAPVRR